MIYVIICKPSAHTLSQSQTILNGRHTLFEIMGYNLKSVLFCAVCIFLMQGCASELNAEYFYEKMAEVTILTHKLEEAVRTIGLQADRISSIEETSKKMGKRITNLEEATRKIGENTEIITNLKETTKQIKKQTDKISNLRRASKKMEEQVGKIANLENNVKKIENMTKGGASVENAIQSLNNQMAQLENKTLNNEKAISKVTVIAKENKLKANYESESPVKIVQDVAKEQSVIVRKMLYAVKQSFHDKFITLKNETKLQLSAMNTSVESKLSSVKTFLKLTENNVNETLNDYSKDMNETFSNLNEEMRIFGDEYERKLESLREKTVKGLDQYKTNLNEANGDIQELQKTMMKVEERQGTKAAFLVGIAHRGSTGIVIFSTVHLNEGSVYDSSTGKFTSQVAGVYQFTANMIENSNSNNEIDCRIRNNGNDSTRMISRQGIIDGKYGTNGWGAATGTSIIHLMKGESVYIYCISGTGPIIYYSSFSGFIISVDP